MVTGSAPSWITDRRRAANDRPIQHQISWTEWLWTLHSTLTIIPKPLRPDSRFFEVFGGGHNAGTDLHIESSPNETRHHALRDRRDTGIDRLRWLFQ